MSVKIIEHADRQAQAAALARIVARELNDSVRMTEAAFLAVPGGATPQLFLEALAGEAVAWRDVTVIATDERCVDPEDERSNAGMIRAAMSGRGFFFPFYRAGQTPEDAAKLADGFVSQRPAITTAVIGMGTDMHCASIFPGAPELKAAVAAKGPLVSPMTPPDGLEPRVTLTARAFRAAGAVRLLITGDEKRAALDKALARPRPAFAPVGAILNAAQKAEVYWAP